LQSSPQLSYYKTNALKHWHASIAKNTAHLAAQGAFVINLDGDNFLDENEIAELLRHSDKELENAFYWGFNGTLEKVKRFSFNRYKRTSYRAKKNKGALHEGSYGRIGISKKTFIGIGGYDESLPPMGGQDYNLIKRVVALHQDYSVIHIPAMIKPLKNNKKESLKNTVEPSADWSLWNDQAKNKTREALNAGKIVSNAGKKIGVIVNKVF